MTRGKGPQAGTRTLGCHSEDKASVYGMPALPTELYGGVCIFLTVNQFVIVDFVICQRIAKLWGQLASIVSNVCPTTV